MRRLLIVNLKRFGDIFSSAHQIQAIKSQYPHYEIGLVVLKEFEQAAKCIANVQKVYTIDRKSLGIMTQKAIFSKSKALKELYETLSKIEQDNWQNVWNMSNDNLSTEVTSFLSASNQVEHTGLKKRTNGQIEYSNEWSLILNEVINSNSVSPFNHKDVFSKIFGLYQSESKDALVRVQKHEQTVKENFNILRSRYNKEIVGIQICTSEKIKEIPKESILQFITLCDAGDSYLPILLIAPTDKERQIANDINQNFNNKLVVIEADFHALVSVVRHLDYLLTPDTAIKHIADLTQTKTLEVSLGKVSFRKQGSVTDNNIIIRPTLSDGIRSLSIPGKDLVNCINLLKNPEVIDHKSFNKDLKIYRVHTKQGVTRYIPLKGQFSVTEEIENHILRLFFLKNWEQIDTSFEDDILKHFEKTEIIGLIKKQKEYLAEISKSLLKTLRSFIQSKDNNKQRELFLESLDELLSHAQSHKMPATLVKIFRGRIDSSHLTSKEENYKFIEKSLYELKGMIQQLNNVCMDLDSYIKQKDSNKYINTINETRVW